MNNNHGRLFVQMRKKNILILSNGERHHNTSCLESEWMNEWMNPPNNNSLCVSCFPSHKKTKSSWQTGMDGMLFEFDKYQKEYDIKYRHIGIQDDTNVSPLLSTNENTTGNWEW